MNYDQARQVSGLMTRLAALEAWRDAMLIGIEQQMPFTLDGRHHLVLADNEAARQAVLDVVRVRITEAREQLTELDVIEGGDARRITLTDDAIQAGADVLEVRGAPAKIAETEAGEVFAAMALALGYRVDEVLQCDLQLVKAS